MTGLRLDKWLWFARFTRTRSLAAKLCASGAATIDGAVVLKPGHLVRVGDVVTLRIGRVLRRVSVLALGTRRGAATEARLLYDEPTPPVALRAIEAAAWVPLTDDGAEKR